MKSLRGLSLTLLWGAICLSVGIASSVIHPGSPEDGALTSESEPVAEAVSFIFPSVQALLEELGPSPLPISEAVAPSDLPTDPEVLSPLPEADINTMLAGRMSLTQGELYLVPANDERSDPVPLARIAFP